MFLGIPDGIPPLRSDGSAHTTPAAANQAVRLRILQKVSTLAAVALRVAVVHSLRCPVPVVARRFYFDRAEAEISYLLPFVIGVQTAGARLVNIQARWALTAITGRTTWPHTFKVPTELRKQLVADLGWKCLWTSCKSMALALYAKLSADSEAGTRRRRLRSGRGFPEEALQAVRVSPRMVLKE